VTAFSCWCKFEDVDTDYMTFSVEWYRQHRDHHLASMSSVDRCTVDAFEHAIRYAESVAS
jgi:hypothetical protein